MKLHWVTKAIALACLGFVGVCSTQLFMAIADISEARETAVLAWAEGNPNEFEIVNRYMNECENGPSEIKANKIPVRPLTFSECAEKIGSVSLAAAITNSEESVEVPAPLRWL